MLALRISRIRHLARADPLQLHLHCSRVTLEHAALDPTGMRPMASRDQNGGKKAWCKKSYIETTHSMALPKGAPN
jgi:hypothetical protein